MASEFTQTISCMCAYTVCAINRVTTGFTHYPYIVLNWQEAKFIDMAKTNSDSTLEQELINDTTSDLEPSQEDVDYVMTSKKLSFMQRLFNNDGRRFRKFVHSTTTHGVIHIFTGKSKIRRFLWLLLVLTSAGGCLYDIAISICRLTRGDTDTNVSIQEPKSVNFPAITLCNLNIVRRSYLKNVSSELVELIEKVYELESNQRCNESVVNQSFTGLLNESLPDLLWNGRHTAKDTIFMCRFEGQNCSHKNFTPTVMPSGGVCYTFNSGEKPPVQKTKGTGTRFALSLIINVQQREYIASLNQDVGIKIAVHPQGKPPQPDELGIAIPPGKNAFVSVRRLNIIDESSKRGCRDTQDTHATSFNFQPNSYSESACEIDCLMSNIAQTCGCLGSHIPRGIPDGSRFRDLQNCTIEDICCQIHNASTCVDVCPVACNTTLYITETSYSAFPANYAIKSLNQYGDSINVSIKDLLRLNVYFETLTVEERRTHDSYDAVQMLSDIGAQLALFLGASVISVLEFLAWIFDEAKDRFLGISERKIIRKVKPVVAKRKKGHKLEVAEECTGDSGISIELQGIDYTKL